MPSRIVSNLTYVRETRPLHVSRPRTPSKVLGLQYERKVQGEMARIWGRAFHPSQWFSYRDDNGPGACAIDGLLIYRNLLVIFEMKTSHTCDAWHQLSRTYAPVARLFFGLVPRLCEVTRVAGASSPQWPVEHDMIFSLDEFCSWCFESSRPAVFLWK